MNQVQKTQPRIVSSIEARHILGIHQSTFTRFVRAGVFRRTGSGFEIVALVRNYFRALEIEARAQAQIEMIRTETQRKLAALSAERPNRSGEIETVRSLSLPAPELAASPQPSNF